MRTCQKARSGFPSGFKWVWKKLEKGEFQDLIIVSGIEKNDKEKAERMALVALWRVQYKPEAMPSMTVVKCSEEDWLYQLQRTDFHT